MILKNMLTGNSWNLLSKFLNLSVKFFGGLYWKIFIDNQVCNELIQRLTRKFEAKILKNVHDDNFVYNLFGQLFQNWYFGSCWTKLSLWIKTEKFNATWKSQFNVGLWPRRWLLSWSWTSSSGINFLQVYTIHVQLMNERFYHACSQLRYGCPFKSM